MSEPKILTHAEVAAARTSSAFLPKQQKVVDFILDSHEALRALLAEAQQERDEARDEAGFILTAMGEPCAECGHVDWRADDERIDNYRSRLAAAERLAEQRGEALEAGRNYLAKLSDPWCPPAVRQVALDEFAALADGGQQKAAE